MLSIRGIFKDGVVLPMEKIEGRESQPIIMEAKFGTGWFVMMCLAPDKYHIAGNDDKTKTGAGKLFQNIMQTWYDAFTPVATKSKLAATWG